MKSLHNVTLECSLLLKWKIKGKEDVMSLKEKGLEIS